MRSANYDRVRAVYELRASSVRELVRTTRGLRANYERELTRELRSAPLCPRTQVQRRAANGNPETAGLRNY